MYGRKSNSGTRFIGKKIENVIKDVLETSMDDIELEIVSEYNISFLSLISLNRREVFTHN